MGTLMHSESRSVRACGRSSNAGVPKSRHAAQEGRAGRCGRGTRAKESRSDPGRGRRRIVRALEAPIAFLAPLYESIAALAKYPAPQEVLDQVPSHRLEELVAARRAGLWLTELADIVERRRSPRGKGITERPFRAY